MPEGQSPKGIQSRLPFKSLKKSSWVVHNSHKTPINTRRNPIQDLKNTGSHRNPSTLNTHKIHIQNHMTYPFKFKPLRDQVSYKQHEAHIMDARDRLCAHYKLNKSDLVKYLIKKEEFNLRKPNGLLDVQSWRKKSTQRMLSMPCFLTLLRSPTWNQIKS